ncbi:uncharacterized protein METZ01_LOCUS299351 [marine metagenome]|uniref:Uncharacterized protein n=1 Tax=marine metagenome TaxID=408172 RepID=A0A382MFI2_9ZZZZ
MYRCDDTVQDMGVVGGWQGAPDHQSIEILSGVYPLYFHL